MYYWNTSNIFPLLTGSPRSLKSICRHKIRQQFHRRNLDKVTSLDLPSCLIPYLSFEEFTKYSKRTEENTHTKVVKKEEWYKWQSKQFCQWQIEALQRSDDYLVNARSIGSYEKMWVGKVCMVQYSTCN